LINPGTPYEPYFHIQVWLIRARLGERAAATKELQTYWAGQPNQDVWPLPATAYLIGRISDEVLLAKAQSPDEETAKTQLCGASLYIGSRRLIDRDRKGAEEWLNQSVNRCEHGSGEYNSAAAELAAMKKAEPGPGDPKEKGP
jgi:lipoprotein NlpI